MSGVIYIRVAQRDLRLASVRYRGLLPGCALEDLGWKVEVGTGAAMPPKGVSLVVAVKPLSERDAVWVGAVNRSGVPIVVDLCDNVFIDGYASQGAVIGQRFVATCSMAAAVSVPTEGLRDVVMARASLPSERVFVVPDIVETLPLLARQFSLIEQKGARVKLLMQLRRLLSLRLIKWGRVKPLVWFGNHGATYASFGMDDLLLFRDALEQASLQHGAELWIVSNNRAHFEQLTKRLPIRAHYFEWTPTIVDELLSVAKVCLVPNSLDEFSLTKSANRALKALNAQVPVVATPTAAYKWLGRSVWLGDPTEGVLAYLENDNVRKEHLLEARAVISRHYSIDSLRSSMRNLVEAAVVRRECE